LWLITIILPAISFLLLDQKRLPFAIFKIQKDEIFFIIMLLAFVGIILIPYITLIPYNIHIDEAGIADRARDLFYCTVNLFDISGVNGCSFLTIFPGFLALKFISNDIFGIRLLSAISGLFIVFPFYLLARMLFNKNIAAISSVILFSSHCFIYFHRTGFPNNQGILFLTIVLLFFAAGLKNNCKTFVYLSGLFCGLGLYSYHSSKVLFPILITFLLFLLFKNMENKKLVLRYLLIFIIGFTLTAIPFGTYCLKKPYISIFRAKDISIFKPDSQNYVQQKLNTNNNIDAKLLNIGISLASFYFFSDNARQYFINRPFLEPITATLFLLGLIFCCLKIKDERYFLLITSFGLIITLGWFINVDSPTFHKIIIALPVISLIAAIALTNINQFTTQHLNNKSFSKYFKIIFIPLTLLLITLSNFEFFFYNYICIEKDKSFYNPYIISSNIINNYSNNFHFIVLRFEEDHYYTIDNKNPVIKFLQKNKKLKIIDIRKIQNSDFSNFSTPICFIIRGDYYIKAIAILNKNNIKGSIITIKTGTSTPVVTFYVTKP
ncbi:MAG: glycosyltransferase family 39 protein, partial [Cyanobacteriota bacterium]